MNLEPVNRRVFLYFIVMELFIIRHGETDLNRQGIVQGRGVNPGLNELGKKQAQLFFDHFKNENFQKIYTSTLLRSIETVVPFKVLNIPTEQREELDEISWGIHEGTKSKPFKIEYNNLLKRWNEGELNARVEGGESPLEVQARQNNFLAYLQKQKEEKVLICMHGRAMRIFICTLLNQNLIHMDDYPHNNLTLYKLNFTDGKYNMVLHSFMEHLKSLHSNG